MVGIWHWVAKCIPQLQSEHVHRRRHLASADGSRGQGVFGLQSGNLGQQCSVLVLLSSLCAHTSTGEGATSCTPVLRHCSASCAPHAIVPEPAQPTINAECVTSFLRDGLPVRMSEIPLQTRMYLLWVWSDTPCYSPCAGRPLTSNFYPLCVAYHEGQQQRSDWLHDHLSCCGAHLYGIAIRKDHPFSITLVPLVSVTVESCFPTLCGGLDSLQGPFTLGYGCARQYLVRVLTRLSVNWMQPCPQLGYVMGLGGCGVAWTLCATHSVGHALAPPCRKVVDVTEVSFRPFLRSFKA